MARTYKPEDLVALPTLDGPTAMALGRELLTSSKRAKDAPDLFVRARKRLAEAHRSLEDALADRLRPLEGSSEAQREADIALDAAWAAVQSALESWARLPKVVETEKQAVARELLDLLFPTGLRFLQLPYRTQWAESETRLRCLDRPELLPRLRKVVSDAHLATVRTTHETYGRVLGITTRRSPEASAPALRAPLDAFCSALRDFVLKTSALADPDDPGSEALVEEILAPLLAWPTRRRPARGDETSGAATDGGTAPSPGTGPQTGPGPGPGDVDIGT